MRGVLSKRVEKVTGQLHQEGWVELASLNISSVVITVVYYITRRLLRLLLRLLLNLKR